MEKLSARKKRGALRELVIWLAKVTVSVLIWLVILLPVTLILGVMLYSMVTSVVQESYGNAIAHELGVVVSLLGTAVVITIPLLGIAALLGRGAHFFWRAGRGIVLTSIWVGLVGVAVAALYGSFTMRPELPGPITDKVALTEQPVAQDAELVTYADQVGATLLDNVTLSFVDTYPQADRVGQYQAFINRATGEFMYGELTVKSGMSETATRTAVAHEYLHHIWESQFDRQARDMLTSHLISLHARDPYMQRQVESYEESGMLVPTELFAFYCTGSSDEYLTDYLLETCNQYIDRSALVMVR